MQKKKFIILGMLAVILALLFIQVASALSSPGYRIDWMVPVTGGAGGRAESPGYRVQFTLGQSVLGSASSPGYSAGLGYWLADFLDWFIHLPQVQKN